MKAYLRRGAQEIRGEARVSITLQDGKLVIERTGQVWSDLKGIVAMKG